MNFFNKVINKISNTHLMVIIKNISKNTYICSKCVFYRIKIGIFSSIGRDIKLIIGKKPTREYVSTHLAFYLRQVYNFVANNKYAGYAEGKNGFSNTTGNDVRIMDGCSIGDGFVIGAGSVVTKDVAPYSIVVGNLAEIIRCRFENGDIEKLIEFQWWNNE